MMEMVYGDALRRNARKFPDKTAVICEGKRRTYREFNLRVNRLANALQKLGLSPKDHVATLSLNAVELMEVYFANLKLGTPIVPLNVRYLAPECLRYLRLMDSTVLVFQDRLADLVSSIRDQLARVKAFICFGEKNPSFAQSLEDLIAGGSEEEPAAEVSERSPAFIIATGGTTGFPKGAVLTHRNFLWNTINTTAEGQNPLLEDVIIYPLPLYYGAAVSRLLSSIYVGSTFIVMQDFDARKCLQIIEKEKGTAIIGNATIWASLIAEKETRVYDTSSMKMWYSAMGALPLVMKEKVSQFLFPGANPFIGYGLTEATGGVTFLKPHDTPREPGSSGRAVYSCEVKIVDEADRELPAGEVGEILVRGPIVIDQYYNNPEETAKTFRGGWLHTGDLGKLDDLGFLYIVSRLKDMIKSGGINIYALEVEEALTRHPQVAEAAVIGVPHEKWGEAVMAIVVLKKGQNPSEQEIIDHCRKHLASYKKPTAVAFVESLPKTPIGKVMKNVLRDQYGKSK
ncbi:MAG: AMP-binding protein [Deltaproteobacteria bacterium]|nr:AMP-binding protein [Deltaproteobacteria bacterium]